MDQLKEFFFFFPNYLEGACTMRISFSDENIKGRKLSPFFPSISFWCARFCSVQTVSEKVFYRADP